MRRPQKEPNEIPATPRPRRHPTRGRRRQIQGRDHNSRQREGKAAGGRGHRCRPGSRDESGKLIPLDVKAGDLITFGKWSGTEVKVDGEDLLIMKESDIMGIVEKTGAATKKAA